MFQTDCRRPLGFVFAAMLLAASAYAQPPQQGRRRTGARRREGRARQPDLDRRRGAPGARTEPVAPGPAARPADPGAEHRPHQDGVDAGGERDVQQRELDEPGQQLLRRARPTRSPTTGSAPRCRPTSSCRGAPTTTSPGTTPATKSNSVYDSPNPALGSVLSGELHAAAAPQLQDRQHPPAAAHQQEEPRDDRRAASPDRGHHGPPGEERVLESRVRAREPEGAAAVARHRPRVAQEQQVAGRHRHHGADRHRRGRGRSRPQRGGGDHRGGADHPRGGRAAGADLRSEEPRLLGRRRSI